MYSRTDNQTIHEANMDSEKVELFFSCRNLLDMDTFSKSDPKLSLYQQLPNGSWQLVGNTETIQDNLNPDFSKSFVVDYIFEVKQIFKVEVVDVDSATEFDFIGNITFELGELMGSKNSMLILNLINKKDSSNNVKFGGKLIVRSETISVNNDSITLDFSGQNISCDRWWNRSGSPFQRLYKPRNTHAMKAMLENNPDIAMDTKNLKQEWIKVHETEPHFDSSNMRFKTFKITASKLCNGDYFQPIKVEFYNFKSNGSHTYKGECVFTINAVTTLQKRNFTFIDKRKDWKEKGNQILNNIGFEPNYSFSDYLRGGLNISAIVCIDFTGSNGDPSLPNSQHSMQTNQHNDYQQAILSVMNILLNYDSDKKIPTYGFGGAPSFDQNAGLVNTHGQVSHFFPCSGDWNNNEGYGVEGVFGLYTNALHNCRLSGPTYFAPLLNEVLKYTRTAYAEDKNNYTVQLILTDGAIHDMQQTVDSIVELSKLPISIIIVGIGNANFGKMDQLDSDDELLRGTYGTAQADIVQFVPFKNFKQNSAGLAQEVLHEVPDQVTGFYKRIGMVPNKPKEVNDSAIRDALASDKAFTRTGTIKDKDYYMNNPKATGQNLLGAFGQNPQAQNYGQGFNKPVLPIIPENPNQGYPAQPNYNQHSGGGYPLPPTNQQLYQNTGQYIGNMFNNKR